MIWVIIIIICIVVIYVFSKFRFDSQNVQNKNISLGGMKKLFPEFVTYFEKNGFEFVEDSGTNLVYKKALINNQKSNKLLFLALESKFTNIMYGYIITKDGSKVKSANVPFSKNYKLEDVEIIIRMITDEFHVLGHLTELPKIAESPVKAEKDLTELYDYLERLVVNADQNENRDMSPREKILYSLDEKEKKVDKRKYLELIDMYTEQIAIDPENEVAYFNRGNIKQILQNYNGAIYDFTRAIVIEPNYIDAIDGLKSAIENQKLKKLAETLNVDIENKNKSKSVNIETVTDINGNIYETVQIGNQIWMAENLRASSYRNGDLILNVNENEEWSNMKTGAYCNYENNPNYDKKYGKLYNWYAVDDKRNLAPEGWHIPNLKEWQILIDYLGGEKIAGSKLKETITDYWTDENENILKESYFSAHLAGSRYDDESFVGLGDFSSWWTTSVLSPSDVWSIMLSFGSNVQPSFNGKTEGFSIRCIKDSY